MSDTKRESQTEFVRWFRKISEDDDKILRVFDRGDYYCVYGAADSEYIALEFYRTKESLRSYGSDDISDGKIPCIYFREQQFRQQIINDYVIRQLKNIFVYKRDNNTNKWYIHQKITPSNLSINSMSDASFNLISITVLFNDNTITLGICLCNHTNYSFEITQFIENKQYTKLCSIFIAKGVKQCILKYKTNNKNNIFYKNQIEKLKNILLKNNIQIMNNNDFSYKNNNNNNNNNFDLFNNIINKESLKKIIINQENNKLSLNSLAVVILHEELQNDCKNFNRYKLSFFKCNEFMRLDNSALNALNLFGKNSLYSLLCKCCSKMGDRLLSIWIRQPLINLNKIYRRQKLIKLFVENIEILEILRDNYLKSLIDLEKFNSKLLNNKINLNDLVELYYFIEKIPFIKDTLEKCKNIKHYSDSDNNNNNNSNNNTALNILKDEFISSMNKMIINFNNYLAMIEQIIDLSSQNNREIIIKSSFDNLLDKYYLKKKNIMSDMLICRNETINQLSETEKTIKLEKHKSYGYCLRIQKSKSKKLKNKKNINLYIILSTQKNCTYFMPKNNNLRKLGKLYIEYDKKYIEREKIIINKIIEITKTYIPVINNAINIFSELDVILSLSHVAAYSINEYTLPKIYNSNPNNKFIKMNNARHPLLELVNLNVIPNNVEMIGNKSSFQIITGPNMGGKSTYIRMIGLLVLMSQIGSYIPCNSAELTIIDSILCRIGASDNQLRGISTFMSEMLESSSILESSTSNSLIVIDELGRGTSTYDGYGIAYSISEHIINKINSFCLFATHFYELSILQNKYKNKGIINKHVTAHFEEENDILTMLYKINNGPCPQSFGISVAKLAKFPNSVIQTAKNKVIQLESSSFSTLSVHTYNQIKQIITQYKQIQQNIKNNNWNKDNKQYVHSIQTLKNSIQIKINQNQELNQITNQAQQKTQNNTNNKQTEKMEID